MTAAVELLDGGATVVLHRRSTARKPPRCSTTRSCARSRSGCATCARWRSGATAILESIRAQGKLDDALEAQIMAADSKARLEDIYLPYKPKRRTKAHDRPRGRRWSRWPTPCWPTRPGPAGHRGRLTSTPTRASPTQAAALDGGQVDPGRALRRGRRPRSATCASRCGTAAGWPPRSARQGGRPAPSSPTTSTSSSPSPSCPRTGSWPCSAARRRRCST